MNCSSQHCPLQLNSTRFDILFLSSGIDEVDEGTFFQPCNWTDSVSSPTRCKKRIAWARAVPLWRAISPRRSERLWVPHAGRSKQRCPRGWCAVVDFSFSFRWAMPAWGTPKKGGRFLPCFCCLTCFVFSEGRNRRVDWWDAPPQLWKLCLRAAFGSWWVRPLEWI